MHRDLGFIALSVDTQFDAAHARLALLARAPVGVEWNVDADHHLGTSIALNRALWIQRKDPLDETPPSDRLIPLPGFYYRWKR